MSVQASRAQGTVQDGWLGYVRDGIVQPLATSAGSLTRDERQPADNEAGSIHLSTARASSSARYTSARGAATRRLTRVELTTETLAQ